MDQEWKVEASEKGEGSSSGGAGKHTMERRINIFKY